MLKLSRKLDYAILAVAHLCRAQREGPVSARSLAERCSVPPAILANILKELTRAGVVRSVRGVRGGYEVAAAPGTLSVGDLVRTLEGPTRLVECVALPGEKHEEGTTCGLERECAVKQPLRRLHTRIQQVLDELSFDQLVPDGRLVAADGDPGRSGF